MGPLRELLATDHRQALEFFFQRLKDVSGPDVDRAELLYNASVLAHYAQVSTHAAVDLSAPSNLGAVFDHFVADTTLLQDSVMMDQPSVGRRTAVHRHDPPIRLEGRIPTGMDDHRPAVRQPRRARDIDHFGRDHSKIDAAAGSV